MQYPICHHFNLGYWTAELGGLNQVVHVWKYGELVNSKVNILPPLFFYKINLRKCSNEDLLKTATLTELTSEQN